MTVNVDGQKYEGSGASKKMAKHACARAALTKLYNMSFTPHMPGMYCKEKFFLRGKRGSIMFIYILI